MIKGKWILALGIIILAAACGDKSTSTGPQADTPENRQAAAQRYLEAMPPQEMLQNIGNNMIRRMPEEARKQFMEALADKAVIEETRRITQEALVKHFTPDELNALAAFFGSPSGKSARSKYGSFVAEIMPQIGVEVKKVFAKLQGPEKEGTPQAEQPTAVQPKPEEPKAQQPKAEQPKAEQPQAEQPKVEQPKAEQPKNK